jgi:hypothetical protein
MTDTARSPGPRLRGLLPLDPVKYGRFKTASDYNFTFPKVSYPIDKSGGISNFGMGGNGPDPTLTVNGKQPCGDCGPNAAPKNVNQTTAVVAGVSSTPLTSNQIVTLYFTYEAEQAGIAWRPPATDDWTAPAGLDNGVDLGDWLLWLFKQGQIEGFLKLELDDLDAALQTFDAVVVGVNLNAEADQQVENNQPWDVGPGDEPDPNDGHAIQYLKALSAAGPFGWATWGIDQPSTLAWKQACPQQAFALLTREQAEGVGFPFATLDADLKELGGTAVPTGPVVRPPVPQPPAPLPASHESWWQSVLEWIEEHLGRSSSGT